MGIPPLATGPVRNDDRGATDVPPRHDGTGRNDDHSEPDVPPLPADPVRNEDESAAPSIPPHPDSPVHHEDKQTHNHDSHIIHGNKNYVKFGGHLYMGNKEVASLDSMNEPISYEDSPDYNEDKQTHNHHSHILCGNNTCVTFGGNLNVGNKEVASLDAMNEQMSYEDRKIHRANISGAPGIPPYPASPVYGKCKETNKHHSHVICGNNNSVTFGGNLNVGNKEVDVVYARKEMEEGTSYMKKMSIPFVSTKTGKHESDDGRSKQRKTEGSHENKRRKKVDMTVAKSEEMEEKCGYLTADKVSNCEHFTDDQIDDMENDLLNFAKSLS